MPDCLLTLQLPARSARKLLALGCLVCSVLLQPHAAIAANCGFSTLTETFSSPATEDTQYSSVINWQGGGPVFATHKQGAFAGGSAIPARTTLSERLVGADAGPLALQPGYTNMLVGLSTTNGCQLVAYGIKDSTSYLTGPTLDTSVRSVLDATAACGDGAVVLIGDVAGDSNQDIVVLVPQNINTDGSLLSAALYVRNSGATSFTKVDITSTLAAMDVRLHGGRPAFLADLDADGAADLVIGTSHGTVNQAIAFLSLGRAGPSGFDQGFVLVNDLGLVGPFADTGQSAAFNSNTCQGSPNTFVSRGCTALAYGDINGDLIADIAVGSESQRGTPIFTGLGAGRFSTAPVQHSFGATIRLDIVDVDGDSDLDLVGFTSGRGCTAGESDVYARLNDGLGNFSQAFYSYGARQPSHLNRTSDWGATITMPLTFQDGVQSSPGAPSFLLGKATGNSLVAFWYNQPATNLYVDKAVAVSLPVQVGGANGAVLSQAIWLGPCPFANNPDVVFSLSPDNGQHWETLLPSELSGSQPHTFVNYGQQLRWRAILNSPNTTLSGAQAAYDPATSSPIRLSQVNIGYTYGGPNNFSRSKVASTTALASAGYNDVIVTASFDFPGWQGHVVAANSSAIVAGNANTLQSLAPPVLWDAATLMPTASARQVTTGIPASTLTNGSMYTFAIQPVPFTPSQAASGQTSPTLYQAMSLSPAQASNVVANVLLGGNANSATATLRDAGHSSPTILAPPAEDPVFMGSNYASFASANQQRPVVIVIGGNDGMLHGFAGKNGQELWGYVPYNLLSKLRSELGPANSNVRNYVHTSYVDGPVTLADVFDGSAWHTIAIVGQADGSSLSGANYYFAVDVTRATTMQPLWEFGEGSQQAVKTCDPDPCAFSTCYYNAADNNCITESQANLGEMALDGQASDVLGQTDGILEAEHFDYVQLSTMGPKVNLVVVNSGTGAPLQTASNGAYVQGLGFGNCPANNNQQLLSCATIAYRVNVSPGQDGSYIPAFSLYNTGPAPSLAVVLDNNLVFRGQPVWQNPQSNAWNWATANAVNLPAGEHTLKIVALTTSLKLDRLVLTADTFGVFGPFAETPSQMCQSTHTGYGCQAQCLPNPSGQEWSTCGPGLGLKCCPGQGGGVGYCQPVAQDCNASPSQMGQAYSPPSVGRLRSSSGDRYAAFFASGYNNLPAVTNVGHSVYMVDALSGAPMASWNLPGPTPANSNPNIQPTIPGGVSLVDADGDGYVDRLYVGDLAGRLWKINLQATASISSQGALTNQNQFASCVVFDAAQQGGQGRQWAPILTKPAVQVIDGTTPNVYFGTGGDLTAPATVAYSFYSVRDTDGMSGCTPTPKVPASLSANLLEWQVNETAGSGRFWTDAAVVNNATVYFSSFVGSPDGILPCVTQAQSSHVYGRATRAFVDTAGNVYKAGNTVLYNKVNYLSTNSIVRSAPTVRGAPAQTSQVTRPISVSSAAAKDVLFQQLGGGALRLSTPGVQAQNKGSLRHLGVREVFNF